MLKLYQIEKGSKILIDGEEIVFHHIDGAYSYCRSKSGIVHLSASTPLVKVNGHYEIDDMQTSWR